MTTPRSYVQNLKKGIITMDMFEQALYSCNKRAKNYRDKQQIYRETRIMYKSQGKYYNDIYKTEENSRYEKEKFYDWKEELLKLVKPDAVHMLKHENGKIEYFLFYEFRNHGFHSPIKSDDLKEWKDMPIVNLDKLNTEGRCINDLLSAQFVHKMLQLIWTGEYELVE